MAALPTIPAPKPQLVDWCCGYPGCDYGGWGFPVRMTADQIREARSAHMKRAHPYAAMNLKVWKGLWYKECVRPGCKYVAWSRDALSISDRLAAHDRSKHMEEPSPIDELVAKWDGIERRKTPHAYGNGITDDTAAINAGATLRSGQRISEPVEPPRWSCPHPVCVVSQPPGWEVFTHSLDRRSSLIHLHNDKYHGGVSPSTASPRSAALVAAMQDVDDEKQAEWNKFKRDGWTRDNDGRWYKDVELPRTNEAHNYGLHTKRVYKDEVPATITLRTGQFFVLMVVFFVETFVLAVLGIQYIAQ